VSVMAIIRMVIQGKKYRFTKNICLRLPGWGDGRFNKSVNIVLTIVIIGVFLILVYAIAMPRVGEKFTEFYLLGHEGKAQNYPSAFDMPDNQTTLDNQTMEVFYGNSVHESSNYGKVTIGVINHEQKKTSYILNMILDNRQVNAFYKGQSVKQIEMTLVSEEKWEEEIGFAPQHIGNNQKLEIFLFKDGGNVPSLNLHIFFDVRRKN
jgi:uncharacterized membrane protein